jgi:hypothetical protein
MEDDTRRALGPDRPINRRDILGGVALGAAARAAGPALGCDAGPGAATPRRAIHDLLAGRRWV